ncbi:FAD dependent oxidoreductase [Sulfobacillus acidophilus DSM 10332]|uniref:FAD dependent oxidoreductase n=1 Tax=Sulfobacillus acidophilus (strain ATCC 700253 / DSM 10332 / NAL) TaxID=679936 RepID=G8TYF7_SULAD|nr:FAD dependent oxidoreductase [Sulfobacillus acidophilus DSM 10332]
MGQLADIIVVGAGVMGASIAHALAERQFGQVVVVEQTALAAAATGQSSGVLRCHYGIPVLAKMANQGLSWFKHAKAQYGVDVGYRGIGYLVGAGPDDEEAFRSNIAMQQALNIRTNLMLPHEAKELWPDMEVSDFAIMAYEPEGGVADPTLTATAFYEMGKQLGVRYQFGQPVTQLLTQGDRVIGVEMADGSRWMANVVIVAAGTNTPGLFDPLGIEVPIRAQRAQLMLINPGVNVGKRPVFSDLVQLQYGRSEVNGTLLIGNSDHRDPEWVSKGPCPQGVTDDFVQRAIERLMHRFPRWEGAQFLGGYSGCYEVTPDYNPIIGPSPNSGLYIAAGFSGHGFKLSPVIGPMMAEILNAGNRYPSLESYVFRLSRFEEHDLLKSQYAYGKAGQMR